MAGLADLEVTLAAALRALRIELHDGGGVVGGNLLVSNFLSSPRELRTTLPYRERSP
jgi:hypothetical protein